MCLTYKLKIKDRRKWLGEQPDIIIAYKVIRLGMDMDGKKKMYPLFHTRNLAFKRINKLAEVRVKKDSVKRNPCRWGGGSEKFTKYIAYYHLFMCKEDAVVYANSDESVIECSVPKEFITDVGSQYGKVIITRRFDIIGQDNYLE